MRPLFLALMLLITLGSVAQQPQPGVATAYHNVNRSQFAVQAEKVLKTWDTAYNQDKDAAKAASLYAEDALLSSSGGSTQGRANIERALQHGVESGEQITKLTITQADSSGKLGFAAGTYVAVIAGHESPGHFVVIFKNFGGKWLITAQLAVPLPQQAAAEKPAEK
jgi:ketosteroid isomerase-like protein